MSSPPVAFALVLAVSLAGCAAPTRSGGKSGAGGVAATGSGGAGGSAAGAAGSGGAAGAPGAATGGAPGAPDDAGPTRDAPAGAAVDAPPPRGRDVVFFAFGDPQYGGGPGDKNSFHIQALNAAPTLTWPAGFAAAGRAVGDPRGVIIAGDLTQNGQAGRNPLGEWYTGDAYAIDVNRAYGVNVARPRISAELGLFLRDYGLGGKDGLNPFVLAWRVFEGYGNHDFDVLERNALIYGGEAPARDIVAIRNEVRRQWPEMRRFAAGNAGHYSWDWDDVHFVQLNLAGADMRSNDMQLVRDPGRALTFLTEDLAGEVGSSGRPVVIVMHYGFDPFSNEERWWDAEQRAAFLRALAPYSILTILHGHVHETRAYQVAGEGGRKYDVVSLGSPYYEGQPTNGGRGHFGVFRISDEGLEAADVSWAPANPVPAQGNGRDLWTGKRLASLAFQTTTTFPEGWGGWHLRKPLPPRP